MKYPISITEKNTTGYRKAADGCRSFDELEEAQSPATTHPSALVQLYDGIDRLCQHRCTVARYENADLLNNGPMSAEKKAKLELSRRRVPRYLFRVFSAHSGGAGGDRPIGQDDFGLNCNCGVLPHAALDHTMHPSIYDMNERKLSNMLTTHLYWEASVRSEFTSWAASLLPALNIGRKDEGCRLAVVDTHRLMSHDYPVKPEIFHIPQLWRAGLVPHTYPHEYHVHGQVRGRGSDYFSMSLEAPKRDAISTLVGGFGRAINRVVLKASPNIDIEETTQEAMRIAEPLCTQRNKGSHIDCGVFIYTVVMLVALRFRDTTLNHFEQCIPQLVSTILANDNVARDPELLRVRKQWGKDECVMFDLVYSTGYLEIKMATRVLRYMAIAS